MCYNIIQLNYFLQSEASLYGIDWNGPLPDAEELEQVEVINTVNPLQERDFLQLQSVISPIRPSDCQGVVIFFSTYNFY